MRRIRAGLALAALAMICSVSVLGAANWPHWPQWRGPGGQGISAETGLPIDWGPATNIAWKTALPGTGMSSPIVWGNRVYVTSVIEGDAIPGQRAVRHRMEKDEDWIHPDSVAGDRRHTFKVVALDAATGSIVWDRTAYEGAVGALPEPRHPAAR